MTDLLYVADPMCSWCWGFAPVIEAVTERHGARLPVRLVMGGLRPFTREPMREKDRAFVREHWQHVEERTGQPFDLAFFERESFVYDTEPAARAVVAARMIEPSRALAMLHAVQRAFYARNADVTDAGTLAGIAGTIGLAPTDFIEVLASEAAAEATLADFRLSRAAGIEGYPTTAIGSDAEGYRLISYGYQDAVPVLAAIDSALGSPATSPA